MLFKCYSFLIVFVQFIEEDISQRRSIYTWWHNPRNVPRPPPPKIISTVLCNVPPEGTKADELISKSSGREERTELTRYTVTFVGRGKLASSDQACGWLKTWQSRAICMCRVLDGRGISKTEYLRNFLIEICSNPTFATELKICFFEELENTQNCLETQYALPW